MAQDEWAEFEDAPPSLVRKKLSVKRPVQAGGKPTGEAHDGDTVRLDTGANARLLGYDAFELGQTARDASGGVVPIGEQSRSALLDYLPGASFAPNGTQSYGRPVGVLSQYGLDPATTLLRQGMGLAAPEYLANDPTRRTDYLEAERLARLNRLGVHGDSYVTPQAFRRGTTEAPPAERPKDGPWAQAEWSDEGGAAAVFADDPTPFQGLRPEIEKGYLAVTNDPNSTVDDIVGYGAANGFTVDRKDAERFVANRAKGVKSSGQVEYKRAPRVLTDPGDGAFGATMRGVGDPLNFLDELGATVDSLGGTGGRENILNSDRRWADIYANNLDQNRSILANDDAAHPYARFGGQLVSGLAIPGASIEGVGLNAARGVLRAGGTRMAAVAAAESAVRRRLAIAGSVEAGAAGAGAEEGGLADRAKGAALSAPVGAALGYGTAGLAQRLTGLARGRGVRALPAAGSETAPALARAGEVQTLDAPADAGSASAVAPARIVGPLSDPVAPPAQPLAPPPGRPGALTGAQYVEAYAAPSSVKEYVEQPLGGLGSAVIGPDGELHMFRTNGSQMGHADEVGHYDFGYATGPDEAAGFAELTRYRGEIAVTRSANETSQQARALNELIARARREGLNIVDERPKPVPSDATHSEWADLLRAYDERHGASDAWDEFEDAPADAVAAMANDTPRPTLDGPRVPDRIDLSQPRQLLADAPNGERIAAAQQMRSSDVTPLPANAVRDLDEAAGIEAGRYQTVHAPNEATTLERRNLPSPNDGTRTIPKRGPVDLVTWLRTQGGVREDGGELAYAGITNAPRNGMDFAGGEQRFGKLVADDGLPLDMAAQRAWEAGYFPDHAEPPTPAEFMDALTDTHRGWNRTFHPDDFAEVDAFEAARAQRLDVEAAQAEGAPLTLDRGQPVGPDDLDANAPPVRSYEEWGENAPDLAGNIRLDKLDSPQAIKRALVRTEQVTGGFDAAKRGRITQAETKALAEDLGMTADDLLRRRKGEAFNAEQALAARQILARSAADLVNLSKRIARTENAGDELEAAFREAWLRHAAIQEQVAGMTAEAGRLLQQFRMTADSRDAQRALSSMGDITGGTGRLREVAEQIVDLEAAGTTPSGINRFVLKALSAKWKDKATEFYINSLLSGPQTHAVNILSNTLTSMAQIPEHLAAAAVGAVRRTIPSQRETERVLFSEAGSRLVGMVTGAREGIRAAARSIATGESSDAITKIETQQMKAIPGPLGSVIRTPSRLLTAEDEFFKAVARRMELGGLATRQAKREGLKGQAAKDRAADLMLNPTEPMLARMFDYARYVTFQTPLAHDSLGGYASRATQNFPALKLLMPFVRTPVNLLKFAAERSPAAPLMKSWRKEIVAGGARRDLAIARMLVGTGFGATMYEMAAAGQITGGGPADDKARRLMLANGWQPYSFKIGDRYYSYSRLDPFATTIGTVADMVDIGSHMTDKQREQSATLISVSIMNNLSNKTWLSGLSSSLEAISDPDRYLQGFLSRTAGAVAVPSIVAQIARTSDPIMRDARAPMDRIRSRIPGMSDDLFPRRDVFGQPVAAQEAIGPDLVSPLFAGTDRNDRTIEALLSANINISPPQRTYTVDGKRVEWSPEQYDRLQVFAGQIAKPQLDALTASPVWKQLTDEQRDDEVAQIMKDARADAKAAVLSGAKPAEAGGQGAPADGDPWAEFQDAR